MLINKNTMLGHLQNRRLNGLLQKILLGIKNIYNNTPRIPKKKNTPIEQKITFNPCLMSGRIGYMKLYLLGQVPNFH
jgi:hypothetical protein